MTVSEIVCKCGAPRSVHTAPVSRGMAEERTQGVAPLGTGMPSADSRYSPQSGASPDSPTLNGGCTWCPCDRYESDTDPSIEREWKFWEGENLDG